MLYFGQHQVGFGSNSGNTGCKMGIYPERNTLLHDRATPSKVQHYLRVI